MNEKNGKPNSDGSYVRITAEIVRQVDLATPSPIQMAKILANRVKTSGISYTMLELFWFSIYNCHSFAVGIENKQLAEDIRHIIEQASGSHYASMALEFGLIKKDEEKEKPKSHIILLDN